MNPSQYKDLKTSRGYNYHYLAIPAISSKPTLLFIHGFPSSSFDWRHQVDYFAEKGFGLIVPDLLGYGGTDKPTDLKAFKMTAMAGDLIEIMDVENVKEAVAIGHDWGCIPTARLSLLYSDRFLGFAWLGCGYLEPQPRFNLEEIMARLEKYFQNPCYGYWMFFRQETAAKKIENNVDSFLNMLYPKDPSLWRTDMAPPGKIQEWIEQNKRTERPKYLTEKEYLTIRKRLLQGGLTAPLNWYKCQLSDYGRDDLQIPEQNYFIRKPAFHAAALKDYVCLSVATKLSTSKWAKGGLTIVDFDTGHWIQLEAPQKLNRELEKWVMGLKSQ